MEALLDESNHGLSKILRDEYRDGAVGRFAKVPDKYEFKGVSEESWCIAHPDFDNDMKASMAALKKQRIAPALSQHQKGSIPRTSEEGPKQLCRLFTENDQVYARIEFIEQSASALRQECLELNNIRLKEKTDSPPYILTDKLPTMKETCSLFRLNDKQSLAFCILAHTLKKEIDGTVVDPLQMLLLGGPGEQKLLL